MLKMTIPIEPVEQQRPRIRKGGRRLYDPAKVRTFKKQVAKMAKDYIKKEHIKPLNKPLIVTFRFYRKLQKSISNKEKQRRLNGEHPPTVRPDLSNYLKSAEDALNGILWKDDAQIVVERLIKQYGTQPRIVIEIKEWSYHIMENEEKKQVLANLEQAEDEIKQYKQDIQNDFENAYDDVYHAKEQLEEAAYIMNDVLEKM